MTPDELALSRWDDDGGAIDRRSEKEPEVGEAIRSDQRAAAIAALSTDD